MDEDQRDVIYLWPRIVGSLRSIARRPAESLRKEQTPTANQSSERFDSLTFRHRDHLIFIVTDPIVVDNNQLNSLIVSKSRSVLVREMTEYGTELLRRQLNGEILNKGNRFDEWLAA